MERTRQSARRKSIFAGRTKIAKACDGALEQLEDRRLLSTASDGIAASAMSRHAAHLHHLHHVRHMAVLATANAQRSVAASAAVAAASPSGPMAAGGPANYSIITSAADEIGRAHV